MFIYGKIPDYFNISDKTKFINFFNDFNVVWNAFMNYSIECKMFNKLFAQNSLNPGKWTIYHNQLTSKFR